MVIHYHIFILCEKKLEENHKIQTWADWKIAKLVIVDQKKNGEDTAPRMESHSVTANPWTSTRQVHKHFSCSDLKLFR